MRKLVLVCVVLASVVTATTASAQGLPNIVKRAGVGGSFGGVFPFDDEVSVGKAYGFNFGLAPEQGLGFTLGFGWYTGDLTLTGVSGDREVGDLRIRPVMAGVGYTWVKGKLATGVSINAGISFKEIKLSDQYRSFFGPGTEVRVDSSNSFDARPQLR